MNKFYLVAVPIGNLEEITLLGLRILRDTKVIFCEDTRVTRKLLNLLDIWNNQELIKLNQFNEKECLDLIEEKLKESDCALVSDAGYPIIADPGYFLVSDLRNKGIEIQVVNGPCAFIHAIVSSGIDSRKIFFANFLTKKYLKRKKELENLKPILKEATVVYYETKNFLFKGLQIIQEVFGDIKIGICRELSKVNETFYYDLVSKIQENIIVKGEFVVIFPRQNNIQEKLKNLDEIVDEINDLVINNGIRLKDACRKYKEFGFSSKVIYTKYLEKYRFYG